MYAKLVVGGSNISCIKAMRDIGRLITSATPSTSLLTGFSSSSSIVVDSTPAGWTYVGSVNSNDQPTIAAIGSSADTTGTFGYTADTHYNLAFSAPMEGYSDRLKYALLSIIWRSSATPTSFALTGAQSVTNLGVATNEGPRPFAGSIEGIGETSGLGSNCSAGQVIHLIATPRGITIINDNRGLCALWETTNTEVHDFYSRPAMVQYSHGVSSNYTRQAIIVPTSYSTTQTGGWMAATFAVNDVAAGTFYGTYDFTAGATDNMKYLAQGAGTYRNNSMSAAGLPRYQTTPVFFQAGALGYPTQYVTGPNAIYWTAASIAASGDAIGIEGEPYTWFNCGTGFGVAMKTS